jgi:2-dehydropantoate 2-reductase
MRIAVVGVGGLGGYIGGRLAHTGQEVIFIARGERLRTLQEAGLRVRAPDGEFLIQPVQATDNPAEVGPVDLVLFCVKTYDVVPAAAQIGPLVGPQTALLPVQNGLEHIEQLRTLLGSHALLGGMALLNAHSLAPGVIERPGGPHRLELGELDGQASARCAAIAEVLVAAGIEAVVSPQIVERMWWKLAIMGGAGVFSVVRGSKGQFWEIPETQDLIRQAVAEGVAVATAHGIALSPALPEEIIAIGNSQPPQYKPSMLVDLEHGRRLEVEALNGALVRLGRAAGVATPINAYIYACLKPYVNGNPAPLSG